MIRCLIAAFLFTSSFPALAQTDGSASSAAVEALSTFAGTWEIVTVQPEGAAKDARRLVFRDDWTYSAVGADGRELWGGTYDLDPTATPKIWDHRSHDSAKTGGDTLGIYVLDGDALKVACVTGKWQDGSWSGKPRPRDISLESADVVLELRRASARSR